MIDEKHVEPAYHTKLKISCKRRQIIHASWVSPIISMIALPTHAQTSQIDNPDPDPPPPPDPLVQMHIAFDRAAADYTDPAAITSTIDSFTGVDLSDLEGEIVIVEYSLIRDSSPNTEETISQSPLVLLNSNPPTTLSLKSLVTGSQLQAMNAMPGDTAKAKASMSPTSIFEGSASVTQMLKPSN